MKLLPVVAMAVALASAPASANSGNAPEGPQFSQQDIRVIKDLAGILLDQTGGEDQDQGKGKGKGKKAGKGGTPGHAKGAKLPPGLQKRLDRGEPLPPGLAGRPLPPGLVERLGPAAPGTERLIAGKNVVLIEEATGIVLDIVRDVLKSSGK